MRFRDRLQNFMIGRYGVDQLNQGILVLSMICLFLSIVTRRSIFWALALVLIGYSYYRIFSKNIGKMSAQNQKYLNFRYRCSVWKEKQIRLREERKIFRFYKCPACKQKVRVPKGKGKILITCPKCKMEFMKKS